jgi:hypothetical protein
VVNATDIIAYALLIGGAAIGAAITRKKKIGPVWGAAIGTAIGSIAAIGYNATGFTEPAIGAARYRRYRRTPQYLRWGNRW